MSEGVAGFLPHSGRMVMLDCIKDYGEDWLNARAKVREDHIFVENGVLPGWATLEMMAQGIAALAGVRAKMAGEEIRLGFLLGTRAFHLSVASVAVPCTLDISVRRSFLDANGFAVFACEIAEDGVLLGKANLNVFSPKDIERLITEEK